MPRDLHPSDGARFLLERDDDAGDEQDGGGARPGGGAGAGADGARTATRARYRAVIYTPDAEFAAHAVLDEDGSVALGATGAPEDLHARLIAMVKLVARDAAKLRADGMPPWPRRILRWRR
jgi:hypothetical protein